MENQVTAMRESIKRLLDDESITGYAIFKETGISQSTIGNLRNGKRSIDNLPLKNAEALYRMSLEN